MYNLIFNIMKKAYLSLCIFLSAFTLQAQDQLGSSPQSQLDETVQQPLQELQPLQEFESKNETTNTKPLNVEAKEEMASNQIELKKVSPTDLQLTDDQDKKATKKEKQAVAKEAKKKAKEAKGGDKSWIAAFLLCWFLGGLGIHRFYLGYTWQGVVQLLTVGGLGVWWLIDFIRIIMKTLKPNGGEYTE
jgi:TM2 domain-containing membrane protein YozV